MPFEGGLSEELLIHQDLWGDFLDPLSIKVETHNISLLCLAYFTWHNAPRVDACCSVSDALPFEGCILPHPLLLIAATDTFQQR